MKPLIEQSSGPLADTPSNGMGDSNFRLSEIKPVRNNGILRATTGILVILTVVFTTLTLADAEDNAGLPQDLTEIGLKQLLDFDLTVTSPGKKKQTLSNVSSAAFVLTQEDIRRSGVTHFAEALRLVPGVDVARVSSTQWAVSIRGFNQVFSNKLLVLIDGISVFSPLTNGVSWETLDTMLDDIDRIEVIRGPGGVLWGANAVNGVVNIVTKSSKETKGGLISAGGGSHERGFGGVRYGAKVSDTSTARVSAKFSDRASNRLEAGGGANDDWQIGSADLRIDTDISDKSSLSTIGHVFAMQNEYPVQSPSFEPPFLDSTTYSGNVHWTGGYTGLHYENEFSNTSRLDLIASALFQGFDGKVIKYDYEVYEFDATHRFSPAEGHDVVYGGSARLFQNSSVGTFAQDLIPPDRDMYRINLFLQDEMELGTPDVHLILGSKVEQNVSTGIEIMPNARIIWNADESNSFWGSISRAVAPPSLVFEDIILPAAFVPSPPGSPGALITVFGDRGVESEDLLSYEIGYRSKITEKLSLELNLFYNRYDNLLTQEPGQPYFGTLNRQTVPSVIVPVRLANEMTAEAVGGEATVEWRPLESWRLTAGYSYLDITAFPGNSQDMDEAALHEGGSAVHKALFRSLVNLPADLQFDSTIRYVDRLTFGGIPGYMEADARLGWALRSDIDLSIIGQNLLNTSHSEIAGSLLGSPRIAIERGVFGRLIFRF